MEKIKILISTKNRKEDLIFTLNQIQNIINQENIECCVYDDGSTDGTYEAIQNRFANVVLEFNQQSKKLILNAVMKLILYEFVLKTYNKVLSICHFNFNSK